MAAKVLFLATFAAGLGLAVYAMLHGVERSRVREGRKISATFNAPTASAIAIIAGAIGYLLVTQTGLGILSVIGIAMGAAAVVAAGMITLMARWALPYSGAAAEEDSMQGQVALVISPIFPTSPGTIVFTTNGLQQTLAAESVQGSAIPRDTEVVIDTVKDGIAKVELWSVVEQRL